MRHSSILSLITCLTFALSAGPASGDGDEGRMAALIPAPEPANGQQITRVSAPGDDPASSPRAAPPERFQDLSPRERATALLLLLQAASPGGRIGLVAR
ncbi:MAG: hypothetical protein AAGA26_11335 [Pseudomonadota bacterium]